MDTLAAASVRVDSHAAASHGAATSPVAAVPVVAASPPVVLRAAVRHVVVPAVAGSVTPVQEQAAVPAVSARVVSARVVNALTAAVQLRGKPD